MFVQYAQNTQINIDGLGGCGKIPPYIQGIPLHNSKNTKGGQTG